MLMHLKYHSKLTRSRILMTILTDKLGINAEDLIKYLVCQTLHFSLNNDIKKRFNKY